MCRLLVSERDRDGVLSKQTVHDTLEDGLYLRNDLGICDHLGVCHILVTR